MLLRITGSDIFTGSPGRVRLDVLFMDSLKQVLKFFDGKKLQLSAIVLAIATYLSAEQLINLNAYQLIVGLDAIIFGGVQTLDNYLTSGNIFKR